MKKANSNALVVAATIMTAILVFSDLGCALAGEESSPTKVELSRNNRYGLDKEKVVVAISSGYVPFLYDSKEGEVVGYDADLLKEFEKRSGIKVLYERADFSGLLGLLQSGRADIVSAQMTPTPEREKNFAFTQPETYYGAVVVVRSDNTEIKSEKDLAGKTIGVGAGNNMQQEIEAMYPNGEVKFELYTSATLENMLKDVEFGRIDGMLAQNIQAFVAIKESGAKCKVLPPFSMSTGNLVVRKDDKKLLDGLNAFLDEIKSDGTLKKISENWIGSDISVPGSSSGL